MLAVSAAVCLIVILTAVSFYFTNGYINIGEDKSRIFYRVAGALVPVWTFVCGFYLLQKGRPVRPNGADWFVVLYVAAAILSTLTSSFRKDAVWGQAGWNMGLLVQLLMVGMYFMARFLCTCGSKRLISFAFNTCLAITGIVLLLGILNRFSIYPIHMMGEAEDFISTIGNINWFCGYWCIWFGLGCGAFLTAETAGARVLYGIYVWVCAMAGISCGSSSAYLAWLGLSFAALMWALSGYDRMAVLCSAEIIMLSALPAIRFIGWLRPYRMWYDSSLLYGFTYEDAWIAPFVGGVTVFGLLREIFLHLSDKEKRATECGQHGESTGDGRGGPAGAERAGVNVGAVILPRIRGIVIGLTVGATLAVAVIIILNSVTEGGIWPVRGMGIFTWSAAWGNSRGGIWIATFRILGTMIPERIFFGVGPDCFCSYAYSRLDFMTMLGRFIGNQYLTCAHNELLTMLVNEGIVGLIAYVGLIVTHLAAGIRRDRNVEADRPEVKQDGSGGAAGMRDQGTFPGLYLAIAAYIAVGTVGFMQILSTPFFFVVLGAVLGHGDGSVCVNRTVSLTQKEPSP
ncbi:MAG: hypothetical protein IJ058_15190 [Lachnospiraceae bacterium]|nr:hypothetical protein [Lachnospiraceae bacterium]MBQ8948125.1 hypothetical protein [Lachnospiraceae bacterium]